MTTQSMPVPMTDRRAQWLRDRQSGIGGSDAPVVLGISSFKSPLDLFTEKIGLGAPDEPNERMEWGLRLEAPIIEAYAEKTGRAVVKREPYTLTRSKKHDFMFATLDAEVEDPKRGRGTLQVKCSEYPWDEEVPQEYVVQLQHEMEVGGFDWGSLALLVRGNAFRYVDVDRHERIVNHIVAREAEFMDRVRRLEPPPTGPNDSAALARLYAKTTGEVIALPADVGVWIDERAEKEAEIAALTERLDHLKNCCRQVLGEASDGILPDGRRISWRPQTREASRCPKCSAEVQPAVTFRVLRFHKK